MINLINNQKSIKIEVLTKNDAILLQKLMIEQLSKSCFIKTYRRFFKIKTKKIINKTTKCLIKNLKNEIYELKLSIEFDKNNKNHLYIFTKNDLKNQKLFLNKFKHYDDDRFNFYKNNKDLSIFENCEIINFQNIKRKLKLK